MKPEMMGQWRAPEEREATIQFLRLVNDSIGTRELIRAVTAFFQQQAGCDAVGVRLQEGAGYPHCETRGFLPEFVRAENQLCARDLAGEIKRDRQSHPILDFTLPNEKE